MSHLPYKRTCHMYFSTPFIHVLLIDQSIACAIHTYMSYVFIFHLYILIFAAAGHRYIFRESGSLLAWRYYFAVNRFAYGVGALLAVFAAQVCMKLNDE